MLHPYKVIPYRHRTEGKYRDDIEKRDIRTLVKSRFKKKILISKGPVAFEGVESVRLVDYLM